MSKEDLADYLGVSVAWVRKAVAERSIPFTKVGRLVRFTPEQVAQIVESGARPAIDQRRAGSARTAL